MLKANIAVLVSGGGTNLQALIDAQKSGIINSGSIKLVVANNAKAYALERAKNAGVDTAVVLKSQLGSQEAFEKEHYGPGRSLHQQKLSRLTRTSEFPLVSCHKKIQVMNNGMLALELYWFKSTR